MKNIFATDKGKPAQTIETHMTGYYLNLDNPNEREQYTQIKAERQAAGVRLLDMITGRNEHPTDTRDVVLETKCLFDNQWNTQDGFRVFDWFESIVPNKRIKIGHYLDITSEMIAIRQNTFKCGYCGHEYYGKHNAGKFCAACLDTPYLKADNLNLLKVMPVCFEGTRPELTQDELDAIMPEYIQQQTRGNQSRAAQARRKEKRSIIAKAQNSIKLARNERDGMLWLYDHNINTENVIYYNHRNVFSFGWRSPLDKDTAVALRELLKDFPFEAEIKFDA